MVLHRNAVLHSAYSETFLLPHLKNLPAQQAVVSMLKLKKNKIKTPYYFVGREREESFTCVSECVSETCHSYWTLNHKLMRENEIKMPNKISR